MRDTLTLKSAGDFIRRLPVDHPGRYALLESWERCRAAGVMASGAPGFRKVDDDELARRLQSSADLVAAAQPMLPRLLERVAAPSAVAYVADRDGIVLASAGHREHLERFGLLPGFDWSERTMGTNGAGTALCLGRAAVIAGREHFVEAFHDCTCTAAPIHAPDRTIAGALDVSSPVAEARVDRIALVVEFAALIEEQLLEARPRPGRGGATP